jgi:hypothetical protein
MTTRASTLKDIQFGPLLTHSQPVMPRKCNTSQETNDLKPAKELIPDNFMQNTSPPTAASKWINYSRTIAALVYTSPELYTKISAFATVSYSSYRMSNTKLNLYSVRSN